jgi:hypothetical protein
LTNLMLSSSRASFSVDPEPDFTREFPGTQQPLKGLS